MKEHSSRRGKRPPNPAQLSTIRMWQITPKKSVGPILLYSSITELEAVLGGDYVRFNRGNNPNEILAIDSRGVHVEVGVNGEAVGVSIFRPAEVCLGGVQLLGKEMTVVEQELNDAGLRFDRVDAGLWNENSLIMLVEQEGRVDGVEVRCQP